jgi:hypothetical protein
MISGRRAPGSESPQFSEVPSDRTSQRFGPGQAAILSVSKRSYSFLTTS